MSRFIEQVLKLMNTELNRIEVCLSRLTEKQIWTRLRDNTNSIGNLCLHLAGNEYQNIISGIGGKPFIRERSKEFEKNEGMNKQQLIHHCFSGILAYSQDFICLVKVEVEVRGGRWRQIRLRACGNRRCGTINNIFHKNSVLHTLSTMPLGFTLPYLDGSMLMRLMRMS